MVNNEKNLSPRIKIIQKLYSNTLNPDEKIIYNKSQYKKFIKDVTEGTIERKELIVETIEKFLKDEQAFAQGTITEASPTNSANAAGASGGFGGSATATGPTAGFDPVLISLIRRSMPNLVAYDLAGVQPMSGPTGLIFAMRSRYKDQSGTETFYNEVDTAFSGQSSGNNLTSGISGAAAACRGDACSGVATSLPSCSSSSIMGRIWMFPSPVAAAFNPSLPMSGSSCCSAILPPFAGRIDEAACGGWRCCCGIRGPPMLGEAAVPLGSDVG